MPYLADIILSIVPVNHIPTHLFSYIPGKTPFSTWPVVISMVMTYLVVIFGTRETMKEMPPLKLTAVLRVHNLALSAGSLILFALIGEEVFSNWLKPDIGMYGSLCAPEAYTNRLEFYLMLNYYFKYYELLDTVFLALRKKPLSFLHVYHHAATVVLAFVHLNGRAPMCWVGALLNLGIHVLMYYYYYATVGGAHLWWKRYLTTMQIAQFMVILAFGTFTSYQYAAYMWFSRHLPHMGGCSSSPTATLYGGVIITSYLVLFIDFFYKTYHRKGGSRDLLAVNGTKVLQMGTPLPQDKVYGGELEYRISAQQCNLRTPHTVH